MSRKPSSSGSSPRPSSDVERLWRALLLTGWRGLVVIPASSSTNVESVLGALRSALPHGAPSEVEIVDGRGASMGDGDRLARMVAGGPEGRRFVAFIDPITQSLAGVPLVRASDAVLLVVQVNSSDVESLSSTLSIVGIDRVIGSVAVSASS
jgi:hypothetical protein